MNEADCMEYIMRWLWRQGKYEKKLEVENMQEKNEWNEQENKYARDS